MDFLKSEFCKFTIYFMKGLAKERQQKITNLENHFKKLEICLDDANNLGKYNSIKDESDVIYNHIEGIQIRSKCNRYDYNK